ncbi:hypothetical protein RvY_03260-2 [Ramazzottius varieornatus]|uniref:Protein kinase domain-containing protein n=1 Tax=Ramazzottius varieornatus TaxID=947166 RepID=A0A1D1UMF6_RAMVA|nr:hypothetical protein RvY_03260-2 [Ramazzottius varieornatus]
MCRYVFHISYSTTCGEKSPDVIYTNKLECTSVEGGRCIRSNRSFGGRSNHRLGPNQTISAAEILVTEAYGKRSTEETIERGEEQEESELSPGALAGAIAGPLLALLCFSVTAVYCCRRYQRLLQERLSSKLLPSMSSGSNSSSSSYSITNTALHSSQSSSSTSTSQTLPLPPPVATDRWELDRSRIAFGASIGNGAYGEVLKGVVEGSLNAPHGHVLFNCTVAIKRLPESADLLEKDAFLREIRLMKALGRHSQVVSLLGACMTSEPILLVLEYCALGDLRGYLSSKRQTAISLQSATVSSSYLPVTCVSQLTLTTLLSFSRQIALGMEYVHGRGYIHRDLAARNLLVTDSDHVKIGDFGLARYLDEDSNYVMLNPGKLPLKWMAIESIVNLAFSPASDVWSFGVVLFEIITMGGTPYPTINNNDLLSQLRKGSRMGCPQNCSQELYDVMMSCWREEPLERPSFAVLETDLCKLLDESAGAEKYLKFDSDKDYYQIDPNKYHY